MIIIIVTMLLSGIVLHFYSLLSICRTQATLAAEQQAPLQWVVGVLILSVIIIILMITSSRCQTASSPPQSQPRQQQQQQQQQQHRFGHKYRRFSSNSVRDLLQRDV